MNFFENIINSISTIFANKLRSGLTMLGIIIGVSSVIIMIAIGEGAQKSVTDRISQMGTNLLIITPGGTTQSNVRSQGSEGELTNDDVISLEELESLSGVSPEYSGRKQAIVGTNNSNVTVTGIFPAYESVRNVEIEYGQFISEKNNDEFEKVAVLGSDTASNLFEDQNPIGQTMRLENNIFTVVGVMKEKASSGFGSSNDFIYIPLSTAQKRVFGNDTISSIYVSAKDESTIDATLEEVQYILLQNHEISTIDDADFTVLNQADALETLGQVTQVFTLLLGGIAGISLLVGGIGVMNIMLVSVTERTREIGIRKAIGAKENDILFQFLTESTILSLAGGFLGVLMSFGVVWFISSKGLLDASITSDSIMLAFIFSAAVGIFFGGFPAYKAGKLKPIDALRFE